MNQLTSTTQLLGGMLSNVFRGKSPSLFFVLSLCQVSKSSRPNTERSSGPDSVPSAETTRHLRRTVGEHLCVLTVRCLSRRRMNNTRDTGRQTILGF